MGIRIYGWLNNAVKTVRRLDGFAVFISAVFVIGLIHYAATKGTGGSDDDDGGLMMLSDVAASSVTFSEEAVSPVDEEDYQFPVNTNAVTNRSMVSIGATHMGALHA